MGFRSGALVAVERIGSDKKGKAMWLCQCDCGQDSIVMATALKREHIRSCGCRMLGKVKHGYAGTKIYEIWKSMTQRCHNSNNKKYSDYGERGIFVCERWKEFLNFLEDMGIPSDGQSLDRIDNNKGYSPENCRWTDSKTQARNKRNNRFLELNGEIRTVAEWAEVKQMPYQTLQYRLQNGWSTEKALLHPVNTKKSRKHY